jgi:hypothetical protein
MPDHNHGRTGDGRRPSEPREGLGRVPRCDGPVA